MKQFTVDGRVSLIQQRTDQGMLGTAKRTYMHLYDTDTKQQFTIPFPAGTHPSKQLQGKKVTYRVRAINGVQYQTIQHRPGTNEEALPYHANVLESNSAVYEAVTTLTDKLRDTSKRSRVSQEMNNFRDELTDTLGE